MRSARVWTSGSSAWISRAPNRFAPADSPFRRRPHARLAGDRPAPTAHARPAGVNRARLALLTSGTAANTDLTPPGFRYARYVLLSGTPAVTALIGAGHSRRRESGNGAGSVVREGFMDQQQGSRRRARRWAGRALAVAVAVASVAAVTTAGPQTAPASAVSEFYTPPAQFPTERGAIVKTTPMPLFVSFPNEKGWPAEAELVMYTSRLQDGTPTVVTGTYLEPAGPWLGEGERPTVVI